MARPASANRASRDAILDCAEQLFAQRGFGGIGLAEVAERAGLAKSSLFHHFPTKAQLYAAVMARLLERIETELTAALAAGGPPVERLERWLDTLVDVLAAHPTYARLLLRTLFEDEELAATCPRPRRPTPRCAGSSARPCGSCARAWGPGSSAAPAPRMRSTPCSARRSTTSPRGTSAKS